MKKEVVYYQTKEGREPLKDWIYSLHDKVIRYRIWARTRRVQEGNWGEDGAEIVILLIGGDKSSQDKDIKLAQEYWRDYNEEKKI